VHPCIFEYKSKIGGDLLDWDLSALSRDKTTCGTKHCRSRPAPYTVILEALHPTPIHPKPHTLISTPHTRKPYSLHPKPYALHLTHNILHHGPFRDARG